MSDNHQTKAEEEMKELDNTENIETTMENVEIVEPQNEASDSNISPNEQRNVTEKSNLELDNKEECVIKDNEDETINTNETVKEPIQTNEDSNSSRTQASNLNSNAFLQLNHSEIVEDDRAWSTYPVIADSSIAGSSRALTETLENTWEEDIDDVEEETIQYLDESVIESLEPRNLQKTTVTLANGLLMPLLAFGTYKLKDEIAYRAVRCALQLGYRHIDAAQMYGNEVVVGQAIRDSGIPRLEIFLSYKIDRCNMTKTKCIESFHESLQKLGLDYVDLLLIHHPDNRYTELKEYIDDEKLDLTPEEARIDCWKGMEVLYAEGRVKALGVSNFEPKHLNDIVKIATVPICVNQVEGHLYFMPDFELKHTCEKNGIILQLFAAMARGKGLEDAIVIDIANRIDVKPSQIVLAPLLKAKYPIITSSISIDHMTENLTAEFIVNKLSSEDYMFLNLLNINHRVTRLRPDLVP
eukprot:TRINITY_DN766_c0_g1_i1.p1 TRINITY_DN766_c0_g1~~TRINITY_DN766_c0_g1_i1.p1  ORF type:complete len:479 (+),score=141.99 TRINITY_DN766_c0_g1_i1:31-1437(+)